MYDALLAKPDDADRFGLSLALRLAVTLGPDEVLGTCHDGERLNYPITGGRFLGRGMVGEVIGSGADIACLRRDGVMAIDALYRIRTDDGVVIVVHNTGLYEDRASSPRGRSYFVTRPEFTAPDGPYDWLNRSVFIGTVEDMKGGVLVSVYEVTGAGEAA
jgi:hypothetical protein